MNPAIVAEGLSKEYRLGEHQDHTMLREAVMSAFRRLLRRDRPEPERRIWALRDVSFDVQPEERVGIIGRNGAGKTTLLKLLSRITRPTRGTVRMRGRIASLVEVGTGFHQELTGRENIYLNGSILGLRRTEIRQRFDAIVAFAGVEPFVDTPIKRYSTGMRLRLGFAVAAHLSPDILLVDEVLAVGDAEFQKKCIAALGDVRAGGRTVLFVSHNLEAVEQLCPRCLWIDGGQIRQDGPTRQVIAAYLATISDAGQGSLDLRTDEGRSGTGEVRYTGLEYLGPDGRPADLIECGAPVTLRLSYDARERVNNVHFGVMFYSDLGTLVAHVNTWSSGIQPPPIGPGAGWLDLSLDGLHLMPGRYYLSLWIERHGENASVDLLEHRLTLIVYSRADAMQRTLPRRAGLVHLPCVWRFDRTGRGHDREA